MATLESVLPLSSPAAPAPIAGPYQARKVKIYNLISKSKPTHAAQVGARLGPEHALENA